jgi:Uma2 family endonuclease
MSPSFNHAYVSANLLVLLRKYTNYTALVELSIEIQGKEYVPDITLYSKRKMQRSKDIIRMTEMPLLAIEVLSPKQSSLDVIEKIGIFFANGVQSCWFIEPYLHIVTVYKSLDEFTTYTETMELQDDKIGIKMSIAEIFE